MHSPGQTDEEFKMAEKGCLMKGMNRREFFKVSLMAVVPCWGDRII